MTKPIHNNQKEEVGDGATLSESPLSMKEVGGRSIDENTIGRGGDACHNPSNEIMGKAQVYKEHLDVEPTDSVTSFSQVDL